MNSDCTIVVCSCDQYEDLWYPFFELFRQHWSDCQYPIVLNTESKTYAHPKPVGKGITSYQLFPNKNVPWSKRLISTLIKIDSEYVFIFLDDDFIIDRVDNARVQQCIDWMKADSNVMCFRALEHGSAPDYTLSDKYENFILDGRNSFRSSVNCMLYRKSQLLKQLRPSESPWEYEGFGMERSKQWVGEYYSSLHGHQLIPYNSSIYGGYGVWHGKWLFNNIRLFEEHGIKADLSKRGIMSEEDVIILRQQEIDKANSRQNDSAFKKAIRNIHFQLYKVKKSILNVVSKR